MCPGSLACVDHAQRRRAFDRALRGSVPSESIAGLREKIKVCEDELTPDSGVTKEMKGLR